MALDENFEIKDFMAISYLKMQSHKVIKSMGEGQEVIFTNNGKPEVMLRKLNKEQIEEAKAKMLPEPEKKASDLTEQELLALLKEKRNQKKGSH